MSGAACDRFVRNAWKKELCSNCFKAKDEHEQKPPPALRVLPKITDSPKAGILKSTKKSIRKGTKVAFPATEFEVIGYGGDDDYSDDDDPPGVLTKESAAVDIPDTELDKALYKLTKCNTDFNSIPSNLLSDAQPVRICKISDEKLPSNPLVVSVAPFGSPVPRDALVADTDKFKDNVAIEEMKCVAEPDESKVLSEKEAKAIEIGIKRSQPIDKNSKYRPNKDINDDKVATENKINDKITTSTKVANLLDKAKKKVHNLPVIGDPQHLKAKSIESKLNNANRGVQLDMFNINNIQEDDTSKKNMKIVTNIPDKSKNYDCSHVSNVSSLHRSSTVSVTVKKEPITDTEDSENNKNISSNERNAHEPDGAAAWDKLANFEGIISGEEVTVFTTESTTICNVERPAPDGMADVNDTTHVGLNNGSIVPSNEDEIKEIPPALPLSPPPSVDPRVSFLHQLTAELPLVPKSSDKPKVPAKPAVIASKKHPFRVFSPRPKSPSQETFLDVPTTPLPVHTPLSETLSDSAKKRPAPQPPSGRVLRATSSSDNLLHLPASGYSTTPHIRTNVIADLTPHITRRSFSLSQDCLLDSGVSDIQNKKKNIRGRFSLRKFLHIGRSKDGSKESGRREYRVERLPPASSPSPASRQLPRSKPEIIHPLELTGSRPTPKTRRSSSSASSSSGEQRESDVLSDSSTSQSVSSYANSDRIDAVVSPDVKTKPLPPPRNVGVDEGDKPARPPPPMTAIVSSQETLPIAAKPPDSFYANIGDVRSTLAPNKPVRTGSLREIDLIKKLVPIAGENDVASKRQYWTGSLRGTSMCPPMNAPEDSGYESFDVSLTNSNPSSNTPSLNNEENVYECLEVVGSRDGVNRNMRDQASRPERRSDSGLLSHGENEYSKGRFLRSTSMPHCGTDNDSEIYSPYSFCGSEMGEEDYEWSPTSGRFQKVSRLKMRKGRSIVHKSLEDNYGAVVIANHEALTQVVQQMHQGPVPAPALRPLVSAPNLRWTDFTVVKEHGSVTVGQRVFYPAQLGPHPVTLCLAPEHSLGPLSAKSPFSLLPLSEIHDLVPANLLPDGDADDLSLKQCSITVVCRIQIDTLASYCRNVTAPQVSEEVQKEIHFVLLLIINALKTLQASGIEEAPLNLSNVLVYREERDPHPRICLLPSFSEECASLCACVLNLLQNLPTTQLSPLLEKTLRAEMAVSLSQAKGLLEFSLWGPSDIDFEKSSRGLALQRWLDLERASVLHGLVRTRSDLSVFEEWQLLFLVHTNAKLLTDASILLESYMATKLT